MKRFLNIAALLLSNISSFAQNDTTTLNEVIVSANKYPGKASLTGKVVTVISREQIEQSGSKDLAQLLTEKTGLFINGANSNSGKDKSIYLRGDKVDHTLITVDGVPVYDPSGIGSNFDIRLLSIDQIERIEILKGSQSTLYGSDAMSGVINIFTRKPAGKPSAINGSLSYGSYNTRKGNVSLSGVQEKLEYNISYAFMKSDGINEAIDTAHAVTDRDAYSQFNINESFTYKPNKNIRISPYLRFSKFNQQYDQGSFTDELDLTSSNTNLQAGIRNEFKIGKADIRVLYNYNKNDRLYTDDSTLSRNGYDIYNKGIYKGKEHFAEAYLHCPVNKFLQFTGGMDYRSSQSDQSYFSIGYFGPYNETLSNDSLRQHQFGVYGLLSANLKNGFNGEIGGRWNRHSAYGSNAVFNINPSWLWKNRWKFFANLSTAYKTPTLYQLYSEYGNKSLKPEKAITLEGGVHYASPKGKYEIRLTAYDRRTSDAITFFYDPNTFLSFYINQDKQHDYGMELEGSFRIDNKTSVRFNYAFVDGRITTRQNDKDTTYYNLFRRPTSTFGMQISRTVNKRVSARAGLYYVGKRKDLSYDAFYNTVEIDMKAYVLVNLYAEYLFRGSKTRFFLDGKNITNTKYSEAYGFNSLGANVAAGFRFAL